MDPCSGSNEMSMPGERNFFFRDFHPAVLMGTASDRYAGWIGQIYSSDRYEGRISKRSKKVGTQTVMEEVLPVESVREYFQHFSVLELDFTFYRPLVDENLKSTQNYHVLETYHKYLEKGDHLILKVPQAVFAQKFWRSGKFLENPDYLDAGIFTRRFYEPAVSLLGSHISGFIFEQEYQLKQDRTPARDYVEALERFFRQIPKDPRYHIEVRTESLLTRPYFDFLEKYGIGQVLSHWTWLPTLQKQFMKASRRFFNAGRHCIVRLMTPRGVRYEDAYLKAFPFDKLVESMISPGMIEDTVNIMKEAIRQEVRISVVINNRTGGNAPLIAREISQKFLS